MPELEGAPGGSPVRSGGSGRLSSWLTPYAARMLAGSVVNRMGPRARLEISVPATEHPRAVRGRGGWVASLVGRPIAIEMRTEGGPAAPFMVWPAPGQHGEASDGRHPKASCPRRVAVVVPFPVSRSRASLRTGRSVHGRSRGPTQIYPRTP
jgi:hypothetical protein